MKRVADDNARRGARAAAWLAGGLALVGALAGMARAAAGTPSPPELQRLMHLLAQRRHGEVAYEEKDYFAILDRPLKSSGLLIYDAPAYLEKRTLKPKREKLVLDHGEATVQQGNKTYHFDLRSYPQAAPYVEALRATMAGDLAGLERVFEVSFAGSLARWRLELVPLKVAVARGIKEIRIAGTEQDVQRVEIEKPNGDRSVMTMGAPAGQSGK